MNEFAQALLQGLTFGSVYAVAAVGFALVYNTTTIFHVAYGALANLGVLLTLTSAAGTHPMRLLATVPLGAVAAAATGVLVYLLIYLPMQRRGAKTISVFPELGQSA